jgi:hypothetical protein
MIPVGYVHFAGAELPALMWDETIFLCLVGELRWMPVIHSIPINYILREIVCIVAVCSANPVPVGLGYFIRRTPAPRPRTIMAGTAQMVPSVFITSLVGWSKVLDALRTRPAGA